MVMRQVKKRTKLRKYPNENVLVVSKAGLQIYGIRSGSPYVAVFFDDESGEILLKYKEKSNDAFKVRVEDNRKANIATPALIKDIASLVDNGHFFVMTKNKGGYYFYQQKRAV